MNCTYQLNAAVQNPHFGFVIVANGEVDFFNLAIG
jgi:hypothetical protein